MMANCKCLKCNSLTLIDSDDESFVCSNKYCEEEQDVLFLQELEEDEIDDQNQLYAHLANQEMQMGNDQIEDDCSYLANEENQIGD